MNLNFNSFYKFQKYYFFGIISNRTFYKIVIGNILKIQNISKFVFTC